LKWLGLVILLLTTIALSAWVRRNPQATPKIMIVVGFLPFGMIPFHLFMAVISWPDWPGHVKGIEFSVLDALALALYLGLPRRGDNLPFRASMACYFFAVVFSVFQAAVPMAAAFYVWQLARMFLVFAAVSRACTDPGAADGLLTGMAAGLCMEAGVAVWGRFAMGVLQGGGTAGHQNLLGLMSHFIAFPFFAMLLSGKRGWVPAAAMLAGVTVEVLTTSRATIGLAVFSYAAMFMISALRRWTGRKALVLLVAVGVLAAVTPVVLSSFDRRFAVEGQSDYDERAAFLAAASMMLSDHPLGVGPNSYVPAANVEGYNARAGVALSAGSLSAHVHNVYWLVAAETGYFGLATYLFVLFVPLAAAFGCGWRARGDQRGDLLLGIGVALLTVYIHSCFEWIFITFEAQYMFVMEVGLMVGVARQLGYWRRRNPRGARIRPVEVRPMMNTW
jgi:O-antigen ligase